MSTYAGSKPDVRREVGRRGDMREGRGKRMGERGERRWAREGERESKKGLNDIKREGRAARRHGEPGELREGGEEREEEV